MGEQAGKDYDPQAVQKAINEWLAAVRRAAAQQAYKELQRAEHDGTSLEYLSEMHRSALAGQSAARVNER
jgi:hypothetical protein